MAAASKGLVAYFSRRGNNYVGGRIVSLAVGNTEVIARKIQELTGCDLFKVETVKPYPEDYHEATGVAQTELRGDARPHLAGEVDIASYDVIFLGYPNWWGTMPMAVFTFLETYDFSGKTIIPFCTHEGSGMGSSERDIKRLSPRANVVAGLAVRGGSVDRAGKEVAKWVKRQISIYT